MQQRPTTQAPKRIAVVLQDLAGGGAERVMLNLAKGFADAGHHVQLVLVRYAGAYASEVPANVEVVALNGGRTIKSIGLLARYFRVQQPDAVIAALPHVNIAAILARLLSNKRTTLIVTEHVHVSIDRKSIGLSLLKLAYWAMPLAYRLADHIVSVSKGAAADLADVLRVARDRVQTIYNPVEVDHIVASSQTPPDHPWFKNNGYKVVLGVGRLVEAKDFRTLIQALAILRYRGDWKLVILGEGPDREQLELLIQEAGLQEHIDLAGFRHDVARFIAHSTVFALSSKWEALPTVLIETLALGTPIVSTDCQSGPAEILESGRYGMLVPVGDPRALAAAIERQASKPCNKHANLQRAYSFSTQFAVEQYLRLIT
jgi:glycosyltransferase involved in cell wall biosynthesis